MLIDVPPVHDHDCERCRYVGADAPQQGEPRCNQVDMYICKSSLVRRYGSEGARYGSWDVRMGSDMPDKYRRVATAGLACGGESWSVEDCDDSDQTATCEVCGRECEPMAAIIQERDGDDSYSAANGAWLICDVFLAGSTIRDNVWQYESLEDCFGADSAETALSKED